MRAFVLAGFAALGAVLGIISTPIASASLLPGVTGTKLTGSSGKVTIQVKGGASFTCPSSATTGEVKNTEEALVLVAFKGCTSGGLAINSVGDAAKTILIHTEAATCHDASGRQYLLLKMLPTKLEIPAIKGLTVEWTGGINLQVTPAATKAIAFGAELKQKEGTQEIGPEECVNSKKETNKNISLFTSTNGGAAVQTGMESAEAKLAFSAEVEFMT